MKILIIEDEAGMPDNMIHSLKQEMYVVKTATNYFSAIEKLGIYEYDCILLDVHIPGGSGLDILRQLKGEERWKQDVSSDQQHY